MGLGFRKGLSRLLSATSNQRRIGSGRLFVRHAAGLFEGTREPGSARYPSRMCIARFSAVARIDS